MSDKDFFLMRYGSTGQMSGVIDKHPEPLWKRVRYRTALTNPACDADFIKNVWKHPSLRELAVKHPAASHDLIDEAIHSPDEELALSALHNPNVTEQHVDHLLTHPQTSMRRKALRVAYTQGRLKPEHLERAKKDPMHAVNVAVEDIQDHINSGKDPKTTGPWWTSK